MPASTAFALQSVLGSVYTGPSNVLFTPDSSSLISPIGARCSVFPLATTSLQGQVPLGAEQPEGQQDEESSSTTGLSEKAKGKAKALDNPAPAPAPSPYFDGLTATTRTFQFELRRPAARMALSPPLGGSRSGSGAGSVHLLLVADRDGRAILVSFHTSSSNSSDAAESSAAAGQQLGGSLSRESVLAHINFKQPLRDAQFSPCARFLAVTHGNQVQVWKVPGMNSSGDEDDEQEGGSSTTAGRVGIIAPSFTPFELHRTYTGHFDDVLSIRWSKDSRMFLTTSKDMTARLYSLHPLHLPLSEPVPDRSAPGGLRAHKKFRPKTFSGHRAAVVAAFFSADEQQIYTVAADGACFVWRGKDDWLEDEEDEEDEDAEGDEDAGARVNDGKKGGAGSSASQQRYPTPPQIATTRWGIAARHYFMRTGEKVRCVDFHPASGLLVTGFSSGVFTLHTLPDFANVHTLSITNASLTTVRISPSGDWLALGSATTGQLMVWEWTSESYVLRQQSHHLGMMNAVAYSQDGTVCCTGGDDGRIKLWNTTTGFSTVTFEQHSSSVSALAFARKGQVMFSASLDGTVRAWDLVRYRNFRTFVSPTPVQFSCLAVEPSGEVVVAGSSDSFEIYMWSVQTGKILEVISGHTGPVVGLAFAPDGRGTLASVSWDRTLRIHEVFRGGNQAEPFQLNADALAVAFRPDGTECCVATLDGQLAFFDTRLLKQTGVIECRRDVAGGRKLDDKIARRNNAGDNAFTSVCYSADGESVLAGGNSNYVCLYDVREKVLLKRWTITQNLDFEGTQDRLDSRKLTEAGHVDLLNGNSDEEDLTLAERADNSLPGAQKGDLSKRRTRQTARATCVQFDPTGRSWAASSTLGLLVYSLDAAAAATQFDPFDLDMDLTPASIREASEDGEAFLALIGALRLGERPLLAEMYEKVPVKEIDMVVRQLPPMYVVPVLRVVASRMHPSANSPHVEFHLRWIAALLTAHGKQLRGKAAAQAAPALREVQAALNELRGNVKAINEDNSHSLLYVWNAIR